MVGLDVGCWHHQTIRILDNSSFGWLGFHFGCFACEVMFHCQALGFEIVPR